MMFQFWPHNWNLRNKDPSNWQTDRPTISPQQGSKQENLLYQVPAWSPNLPLHPTRSPNNETEVVKHWKCLGRHIVGGKKGWIYEKKQRNKETNQTKPNKQTKPNQTKPNKANKANKPKKPNKTVKIIVHVYQVWYDSKLFYSQKSPFVLVKHGSATNLENHHLSRPVCPARKTLIWW